MLALTFWYVLPGLSLVRGGVPVAGGRAILEMDSCGQPMRID